MGKDIFNQSNETLRILLDYSWEKYNKQNQYFDSLDSKSATMSSFIGLLFSIISGFCYYLLANTELLSLNNNLIESIIFIVFSSALLIVVIISFYLSLSALGIRKVVDPAKISDVKMFYRKNEREQNRFERKFIIYIINSLENAEISFRNANYNKSQKIKMMTMWLKAATILILLNLFYVFTISII
jgi:hypothetical protein